MTYPRVSKFIFMLIFTLVVMFASVSSSRAQEAVPAAAAAESVPRLIQFNGILKDTSARPVGGAASVTFAIYSESEGGAAIWSETQNVLADATGHYTAVLGSATSGGFPAELFGTGQSRWLGVAIARQPEMPARCWPACPRAESRRCADIGRIACFGLRNDTTADRASGCGCAGHDDRCRRKCCRAARQNGGWVEHGISAGCGQYGRGHAVRDAGQRHWYGHCELSPVVDFGLKPWRFENLSSERRFRWNQYQHAAAAARCERQLDFPWVVSDGAAGRGHRDRRAAVALVPMASVALRQQQEGCGERSFWLPHRTRPEQYRQPDGKALSLLRTWRRPHSNDTGLSINSSGIITFNPGQEFSGYSVSWNERQFRRERR